MRTTVKLITPPTVEPVLLAEAKLHCRVDTDTTEDTLITSYIMAARMAAEQRLQRALIEQTWELWLDAFEEDKIELMYPPLMSIVTIKYKDGAGIEQTLANTEYRIFNYGAAGHYVEPVTAWPSGTEVKIQYKAGYGTTDATVPNAIKSWILLAIGTMYSSRESLVTQQGATSSLDEDFMNSLLEPYRILSA